MVNESDIKDYSGDNYPQPTGRKDDGDKPPMQLIDAEYLEGLARVLGFGAKKYAPDNWRGGIEYGRLIGAAYRHLGAINKGEDIDPESGEPHVYHLACCTMFLSSMMAHRPDLDDRYKPNVGRPEPSTNKFVERSAPYNNESIVKYNEL